MKGTTLCVWRNVTCCRSVTNVRLHFQCHYIIVRQRFMLGKSAVHHIGLDRKSSRKYWNYVLGNMNMTVNLWYINLSDERTNMNEWTSNSFFPRHSNTMTSRTSSPAEKESLCKNLLCTLSTYEGCPQSSWTGPNFPKKQRVFQKC